MTSRRTRIHRPAPPPSRLLIMSARHSPDARRVAAAAQAAGYATAGFSSDDLPAITNAAEVKVYCEHALADYISRHTQVVPLRPLDEALAHAPAWATKRRIRRMPVALMRALPAAVPAGAHGSGQRFHIAGVYADTPDTPEDSDAGDVVVVSDIVQIVDGYRHFVLDGTVVAATAFQIGGIFVGDAVGDGVHDGMVPPRVPPAIIAFAERVAEACADHLPPAHVVDIGVTTAGETALIAFHPAWAARIYGADAGAALPAILAACGDRRTLPAQLRRFAGAPPDAQPA